MSVPSTAVEVSLARSVPTTAGTTPKLTNNANPLNTPGATGLLAPPQAPSGAVVTNTNRTNMGTKTYMAASLNKLNVGTTPPPAKN